jgi:hypothetical protein
VGAGGPLNNLGRSAQWRLKQIKKLDNRIRFRVDVPLHDMLINKNSKPISLLPNPAKPTTLSEPVYPCGPIWRKWLTSTPFRISVRGAPRIFIGLWRGWLFPNVRSRVKPGDFHPIICYRSPNGNATSIVTIAGHDNSVKGMTEDIARRSIDWLHDHGCRVLPLMRDVIDRLLARSPANTASQPITISTNRP